MDFQNEVETRHKELLDLLESIDVDSLSSNGLSISFGGKTFQFKDVEVTDSEDIESKLKREFKTKLNDQQQVIREKINNKINQLLVMHRQKQQEFDRKEQQLQRKYRESAMMPDITERHASQGLSVVKGGSNDELLWIYRGVYNPKFYTLRSEKSVIEERLVNKMKMKFIIAIRTSGTSIMSIRTYRYKRSSTGHFSPFPHYHQMSGNSGDCWGNWKYNTKQWRTPDDIIKIAREAEGVLGTINKGSIATNNPAGLPRLSTIEKNITKLRDYNPRETARPRVNNDEEDVWSL